MGRAQTQHLAREKTDYSEILKLNLCRPTNGLDSGVHLRLLWEELIAYLKEERHGQPVLEELEQFRVA